MKKITVKVKTAFRDRYSGVTYKAGHTMEITDERYREIKRSGDLIEVVKPEKKADEKK